MIKDFVFACHNSNLWQFLNTFSFKFQNENEQQTNYDTNFGGFVARGDTRFQDFLKPAFINSNMDILQAKLLMCIHLKALHISSCFNWGLHSPCILKGQVHDFLENVLKIFHAVRIQP